MKHMIGLKQSHGEYKCYGFGLACSVSVALNNSDTQKHESTN